MSPSPPPSSGCSLAVLVGGTSTAGSSKRFRHAILRNLLLGLSNKDGAAAAAAAASPSSAMSLRERRDAVRHAADAALAAARGAAPRWSRALAAELSSSQSQSQSQQHQTCLPRGTAAAVAAGCRKTVPTWRRRRVRARPKSGATTRSAGAVARARALRRMVPGGRGMADECTLLGETLDYAVSLRAQVDAMQLLLRTLQQATPTTLNLLKQQQ